LVDYSIKTWAMTGPSSPSPERDEFFPVLYSTTASKLPATLGMDLNSEPARSQAIQRARRQHHGDRSECPAPQSDWRGSVGLLLRCPRLPLDSVEARRRNILGIIVGAFQTGAVLDAALAKTTLPQNVDLYLYPAGAGTDAAPVYVSRRAYRAQVGSGTCRASLLVGSGQGGRC
jgi:hypothetical protein